VVRARCEGMLCDLNHRLAISEAPVGRKKSCGQLRLKVRSQPARKFMELTVSRQR
jgi:hypothetical protein